MFALIHNGSIKVGPRNWSYWIFRRYLEENGLSFIELTSTFIEPIITTNWQIVEVTAIDTPAHNPLFEQLAGPFWQIHSNYVTGYYNVEDKEIELIKSHMKEIVAANRYEIEIQGIEHTFQDSTVVGIYTDREDRNVYLDALLIMGDTDVITFKFKNGVFKEVNKAELQAIVYTGSMHIKNLFGWESTKTAEIDSTTTIADLKLIDLKHELQNGN